MIRIGDFSRISQIPVSTLRYYDDVGLLKPIEVDRFTGYRYYTFDQLPRLNRILALKDLGFSLEEIARMLGDDLPADQLRGMLRLKRSEMREQVQEAFARLERVETRLKYIEQENMMSTYVVQKKVEPMLIAGVRGVIAAPPEQKPLWDELVCGMENQGVFTGPCFALYHSEEPQWDIEVCWALKTRVKPSGQIKVYELPAVATMASVVHNGPFVTIGEAYKVILKWIESNGYRVTGPCREIYLHSPELTAAGVSQTDPSNVTEIQFPMEIVR
jgi:DNA-binding transcriptional MerR regulator/effector-binding domain-containing protein